MLAFIGGTGPEGLGLAYRFALAGEQVVIGSRSAERAQEAVAKIRAKLPEGPLHALVHGAENPQAVRMGSIVLVTVPFSGHADTLAALKDDIGDKLVIDIVVPLAFEGRRAVAVAVPEGSVAQQAQAILPNARVVGAFHNIDAHELFDSDRSLEMDVIVCADDAEAKQKVMALAEKISGVRAVDGGALANSRFPEDFTAMLLNINRIYRARTGIKIVGINRPRPG